MGYLLLYYLDWFFFLIDYCIKSASSWWSLLHFLSVAFLGLRIWKILSICKLGSIWWNIPCTEALILLIWEMIEAMFILSFEMRRWQPDHKWTDETRLESIVCLQGAQMTTCVQILFCLRHFCCKIKVAAVLHQFYWWTSTCCEQMEQIHVRASLIVQIAPLRFFSRALTHSHQYNPHVLRRCRIYFCVPVWDAFVFMLQRRGQICPRPPRCEWAHVECVLVVVDAHI